MVQIPLSSKVRRKNSATSTYLPIAANDCKLLSESPRMPAVICAASWSCRSPFGRSATSVHESGGQTVDCRNTGMDIVLGYLVTGFSGRPLTFLLTSASIGPMRSIGFPMPSKGTSSDFFGKSDLIGCPVRRVWVLVRHAMRFLKYLNNGFVFVYSNITSQFFFIADAIHDFLVGSILHLPEQPEAIDLTKA